MGKPLAHAVEARDMTFVTCTENFVHRHSEHARAAGIKPALDEWADIDQRWAGMLRGLQVSRTLAS